MTDIYCFDGFKYRQEAKRHKGNIMCHINTVMLVAQ